VLIDKYEVVSLPVQTTVRPALNAPSQPGEPGPLSYNDLFAISMRGKSLEITTLNGSIFKGELVSVGPDVARLNVEGMEVLFFEKWLPESRYPSERRCVESKRLSKGFENVGSLRLRSTNDVKIWHKNVSINDLCNKIVIMRYMKAFKDNRAFWHTSCNIIGKIEQGP